MYESLAILAAFVFLYSLVGGGLEKTPFNGAIVFAAFGFCLEVVLPIYGFGGAAVEYFVVTT